MGDSSAKSRPLDRALDKLIAKEPSAALAEALGVLEVRPDAATLLVTGLALEGAGAKQAADVLRCAAYVASLSRSLPLAAASIRALGRLGESVDDELDSLVAVFSRPASGAAAPPVLDAQAISAVDLPLAQAAERALAAAERARGSAKASGTAQATEPLWLQLGAQGVRAFAGMLELELVPAGAALIREGDAGNAAYLVGRGELEVRRGDLVLARLGAGSLFGEMALLSRSPRAASVVAARPSIVLRADRDALDGLAGKHPELAQALAKYCRRRMIENLVRTSAVLKPLRSGDRHSLLDRFVARTFETGETLIAEGEEGAGMHLVASGSLSIVAGKDADRTRVAMLGAGDVVGEVAMVLRRPATAAVVADCPSVTLHLPAGDFLAVIKQHPALLAELYTLAVERHEETRSLLAQQADDASDLVLF
jgi:cAMP-dependent protein kinase regulator